jgi:hypothetical protein
MYNRASEEEKVELEKVNVKEGGYRMVVKRK